MTRASRIAGVSGPRYGLVYAAGVANAAQGWGRENETWQVRSQWREFGIDTWFRLGDRDIALHLYRREDKARGLSQTQVSRTLSLTFAVPSELLPM